MPVAATATRADVFLFTESTPVAATIRGADCVSRRPPGGGPSGGPGVRGGNVPPLGAVEMLGFVGAPTGPTIVGGGAIDGVVLWLFDHNGIDPVEPGAAGLPLTSGTFQSSTELVPLANGNATLKKPAPLVPFGSDPSFIWIESVNETGTP